MLLLLLIPILTLVTEAFNGVANRLLPGHGYRNLTVTSPVLCGRECLMDDRCFSFHYSEGARRCELNGATASRHPTTLIERDRTIYFGPEEPSFAELLVDGAEVAISLTDCWYHTHASAASECNKTGQHLCLQWELSHASKEGYPATPPSWYADPDSLAVLSETGVAYHDLPLTSPSPGLCCSLPMSYRNPVFTRNSYDISDRAGQMKGCSDLTAHLCTLAELKEAYGHGYRCGYWFYFATPNRDASVAGCSGRGPDECYQGVIPHTPRPGPRKRAYCCPNRA